MSVFDGEIDFHSVTMVDFVKKNVPKPKRPKPKDDDCIIIGLGRDTLNVRNTPFLSPDILCPLEKEYYKKAVERYKKEYPMVAAKYMTKDIDPVGVDHEIQDLKRTEYLIKYCRRDLPFMSANLVRRAKAVQSFKLPEDVYIPATTQRGSFRWANKEKYVRDPTTLCRPKGTDGGLRDELRRILRVRTGETSYSADHGLLAQVILKENPFGKPREEPKYGRWLDPYYYTYRLGGA